LFACGRIRSHQAKEPVPAIEWCDEAWVEKKFGVPANKLVDLLGLMGDSIDNIPGAPGVGPRARSNLSRSMVRSKAHSSIGKKSNIKSIASLCATMRSDSKIARAGANQNDVEVHLDLDQLERRPPDRAAAYELFRELNLQT